MSVEVRIVGLLVRVRVGEVEDAVICEAEELCDSLGTRRGLEGQGAVFPCGDEPVGLNEDNNQLDALRIGNNDFGATRRVDEVLYHSSTRCATGRRAREVEEGMREDFSAFNHNK